MFLILWTLLLPFALGKTLRVDITKNSQGTRWSSGWSPITGPQYFGGTLMSVRGAGATLTYTFTGTAISVYGIEETNTSYQANSSYALDGSMPRLSQEPTTDSTSNVLLYASPLLEDARHTLVIQNLAPVELKLDYFEVTESTVRVGKSTLISPLSSRSIHPRNEPLQPAVIAGLALAAVAVLLGFIILFIFWRREHQREGSEHPKIQFQSQGDGQMFPFLGGERARIEPFIATSALSHPLQFSQSSSTTIPALTLITPAHRRPSREQLLVTQIPFRNEKRTLPTAPVYTMESISRLNLGLDVNQRDHSVVGQPSNYGSEVGVGPRHQQNRENDGGVSLLGSSETINPKVLRLPPDYRFYL